LEKMGKIELLMISQMLQLIETFIISKRGKIKIGFLKANWCRLRDLKSCPKA